METLLSVALLLLVIGAVVQMVYERILAPTLRVDLKHKLFGVRDDLYALKVEHPVALSDEVFDQMLDSINGTMLLANGLTITDLWDFYRLVKKNEALAEKIAARRQRLRECRVTEIKDIVKRNNDAVYQAVFINSACGVFYLLLLLLPLALVGFWWSKIRRATEDLALAGGKRDAVPA